MSEAWSMQDTILYPLATPAHNGALRDALRSPLFRALQSGGLLDDDHAGGCVLYEKRALVEALLNK